MKLSLDTLVADFPDTYKLAGQDEVSKAYSFPKSYVSYRKPRAVRNCSEITCDKYAV